jgi:selenide,water dikinase
MNLKLTQTVQKGGCAAKVAASELKNILSQVRFPVSPEYLKVDSQTFDDAAILNLQKLKPESKSLVQTLDFFTPIVDSPHWFGKIATANALSDVYAMGGWPISAMAILAFPLATLDTQIAVEVLQGACDVLTLAETPLVGGHSIDDDTLKFGLSVTGLVESDLVWSNANAQLGDDLILTKAIGTGTITAALKRQEVDEDKILDALISMSQINNIRPLLGELAKSIHSATDITGFGLAGHSSHMAGGSHCSLEFQVQAIPLLPQVHEFLEKGFLTKAHRTNREYIQNDSDFSAISESQIKVLVDPQTSGGLLLSVDPKKSDQILKLLKSQFPKSEKVGKVIPTAHKKLIWK